MNKRGGWRDSYEQDVVHPAVAKWLTDSGFIYEHESRLPYSGQVDFFATDGKLDIIVECKPNAFRLEKSVAQLLEYHRQFKPRVKPFLALPERSITHDVRCYVEDNGLYLHPVAVPQMVYVNLTMEMLPQDAVLDHMTANVMARLYMKYGFPDDLAEVERGILEAKRKLP